MRETLLSVCLPVLGGFLAGVVCLAVGGFGGLRTLQRRLANLEDEVQDLERKHVKEVKRRAGESANLSPVHGAPLELKAAAAELRSIGGIAGGDPRIR